MKGFMNFVREQGVVGLAVGFILGGALSNLVEIFTRGIVDPLVAWAFNTGNLGQQFSVLGPEGGDQAQLAWGPVVVVAINFIIVAAVVYFGVKALKLDKLDKKKK